MRDERNGDATTQCGEEFFFSPPDGQYFATQGDFTGHGDVGFYRFPVNADTSAGGHGDTGGRAVFGGAFGHVDVNVFFSNTLFKMPQLFVSRTHDGTRCFHRLFSSHRRDELVRVRDALPGMICASMVSNSPPTSLSMQGRWDLTDFVFSPRQCRVESTHTEVALSRLLLSTLTFFASD